MYWLIPRPGTYGKRTCEHCGKVYDAGIHGEARLFCPHCGKPSKENKHNFLTAIAIAGVILVAWYLFDRWG